MAEDWRAGGFGLYVHWPFCASKCPYCDFNSHVGGEVDPRRWSRAYVSEIDRLADETGPRPLTSIFFGGGTPSLMDPQIVADVIAQARARWPGDPEITLEANPGSVEASRFAGYAQAGVNRVSLGVQALNDTDLRRLGRMHSVAEARDALDIARAQFDRVSFDLIYARQDQSLAEWRRELTEALTMQPDHLSLYQLTVEPGTVFGARHQRGQLRGLPNEDLGADMYDLTQETCEAAGLPAYEVSNHARPGAESRHNLIYWRAGDYAGIGPGAHGRLTLNGQRFATETPLMPDAWLEAAVSGNGESGRAPLPRGEQAVEYLMMGLRIREGLNIDRFRQIAGNEFALDPQEMIAAEMIEISNGALRLTPAGRPLLNAVLRALI